VRVFVTARLLLGEASAPEDSLWRFGVLCDEPDIVAILLSSAVAVDILETWRNDELVELEAANSSTTLQSEILPVGREVSRMASRGKR